jgi:ABC-type transport system involved in multi-copper enzyme maturation permease subunit
MKRALTVAGFTYRELIRSNMLYVWLVSVVVLSGLALVLSMLSFGDSLKIFLDLGLVAMEMGGIIVLLLSLAVTYNTEMDQKAIFLQLAKPVTRGEYLLGRVLGFFLVVGLFVVGVGLVITGLAVFWGGTIPPVFLASWGFLLMEMFVLCALGLTYQMLGTSMVGAFLYTFFTIFLGHLIGEIEWLLGQDIASWIKTLLRFIEFILPNLEAFNLMDRLYDPTLVLGWVQWRDVLLYAFGYSFVVFLIGWINLEKREFK